MIYGQLISENHPLPEEVFPSSNFEGGEKTPSQYASRKNKKYENHESQFSECSNINEESENDEEDADDIMRPNPRFLNYKGLFANLTKNKNIST